MPAPTGNARLRIYLPLDHVEPANGSLAVRREHIFALTRGLGLDDRARWRRQRDRVLAAVLSSGAGKLDRVAVYLGPFQLRDFVNAGARKQQQASGGATRPVIAERMPY